MSSTHFQQKIACILGNFLDHYDTALYGLLAPFLAPLFFDNKDPLVALIMVYGMLPLGFLTRPLGALFFGWIGDFIGRAQALSFSLLGVAISTFLIAFLPSYKSAGIAAPIALGCLRMAQSFFAAGESTGGAIYMLEKTEEKRRDFMGSLFDASSVAGILVASVAVALLIPNGGLESWRLLFMAGGITALAALFFRQFDVPQLEGVSGGRVLSTWKAFRDQKRAFFQVTIASGFSHITYYVSFVFMQGFLPQVTSLRYVDVIALQPLLLVFDLILLPFFGLLSSRIGGLRVMMGGVLGTLVTGIFFFCRIQEATLVEIILFQGLFIFFGVAFAAPYRSWSLRQIPASSRYRLLSLASTIGGQWIGAPTVAISLWLFKEFGLAGASFWLITFAFVTLFVLGKSQEGCEKIIELNPN